MKTTKAPIQVDDCMLTTNDRVIITLIHSTTDQNGIKMRHNDFSAFQFLVNLPYPTSAHIRSGKHYSVFNFTTFAIGRFSASIKPLLTLCINNIIFFSKQLNELRQFVIMTSIKMKNHTKENDNYTFSFLKRIIFDKVVI